MSSEQIPVSTIARLFREVAFQDDKTRISTKTLQLSAEYIRLFTREAILRSNEERLAEDSLNEVDGIDNVENQRNIEEKHDGIEARVEDVIPGSDDLDIDIDEDAILDTTQLGNAFNLNQVLDNDLLDTRHLGKVAGVLVLDF